MRPRPLASHSKQLTMQEAFKNVCNKNPQNVITERGKMYTLNIDDLYHH